MVERCRKLRDYVTLKLHTLRATPGVLSFIAYSNNATEISANTYVIK